MQRLLLLATLMVLPGALMAQPASSDTTNQPLLLANARIVDPATKTVTEGALLIRSGRIAAVLDAATADFEGRRIDLGGQWILPDLHVHSHGNMGPADTSPRSRGPSACG